MKKGSAVKTKEQMVHFKSVCHWIKNVSPHICLCDMSLQMLPCGPAQWQWHSWDCFSWRSPSLTLPWPFTPLLSGKKINVTQLCGCVLKIQIMFFFPFQINWFWFIGLFWATRKSKLHFPPCGWGFVHSERLRLSWDDDLTLNIDPCRLKGRWCRGSQILAD